MTVVVPVQLSYNVPCEMCHKPFKRLYPLEIDGQRFMFCSGSHAQQAYNNWEEKKKIGYTNPEVPQNLQRPEEEMTDMELNDEGW